MRAGFTTLVFLAGFVLMINEGEAFPWINTIGLGLVAVSAWLSNKWGEIF